MTRRLMKRAKPIEVTRHQVAGVDRLLRLPEVQTIARLGKTMIYAKVRQGTFPRPVKIGGATMWSEREVAHWIEELMAARDAA